MTASPSTRRTLPPTVRLTLALGIVLLAVPVASARAADTTVTITTKLSTGTLTVSPGTTVQWVNRDGERHRVRSDDGPEKFDSGNLEPGESYAFNFAIEGSYPYVDHRDDDNIAYHGVIIVAADVLPPLPGGGDGGGGDGDPPPSTDLPAVGTVSIGDDIFVPAAVTVAVGGTVDWTNNDDSEHTVTSTGSEFDSGIMNAGAAFSQTFETAGSFPYVCILHSDMRGTVTVTARAAGDAGGLTVPSTTVPSTMVPSTAPPPTTRPSTTAAPGSAPASQPIALLDFEYDPGTRTVESGTTVRWVNRGEIPHTVTSDAGGLDSGLVLPGDDFTHTFAGPGVVDYLCTLHPEMTGTITVVAAPTGVDSSTVAPARRSETRTTTVAPVDEATEVSTPPPPQGVRIVDQAYQPEPVVVDVGATVRWSNVGAVPHTVTADDGSFDSGIILVDGAYEQSFDTAGSYPYLCTLHPDMVGTVEVRAPLPGSGTVAGSAAALGGDDRAPSSTGGGLGIGVALALASIIIGSAAVFSIGMSRFANGATAHR